MNIHSPLKQDKSSKKQFSLFKRLLRRAKQLNTENLKIGLYDKHNLDSCPWPDTSEGQSVKKFLMPLIQEGMDAYVNNIRTDLRVLVWDQLVLPITINTAEYENSYVCSPYSYFISYARESLDSVVQGWIRRFVNTVLHGFTLFIQYFQMNKVVVVNNWPFSTSLYPQLNEQQLQTISQYLQNQFPDHAIVFRSVETHTNPICYQTLRKCGFDYIATRQIFYSDPHRDSLMNTSNYKSDIKRLRKSGYEILDQDQLSEKDIPRLLELYRGLYLQKYSTLNPQFNEKFTRLMLVHRLMHFKVLVKDGRIDGVIGYMERNGMMYCPFFGYDLNLPKDYNLYCLLSTVLMIDANQKQLICHQSSGASIYKKTRRANTSIDYMAVYHRHLSFKRRIPWKMIKALYNSLGIFYMKRY